ncbi:MAG: cytochrome P450 [Rhodospirillales bacterium]|nr:cytochrome P450 [Rhodospirillales bacterium]
MDTVSIPDPASMPIAAIDVSDPALYRDDTWEPWFARLRRDAPVHWQGNGQYGAFWSITRAADVLAVETDHARFSSAAHLGGITITDRPDDFRRPSFISMDPPQHTDQRRVVAPAFTPTNLGQLAHAVRRHAAEILDDLPRNEDFDWVDRVSIELTTRMLATLFGFPFAERRKLPFWSDVATMDIRAGGIVDSEEKRLAILRECLETFTALWHERAAAPPGPDLLSMLAHGAGTRDQLEKPMEFLGNLVLLIVGGNDTTRNSISGGLWAFDRNPGELAKLRADPRLAASAAQEIVRWQSPIIHMRRTAIADAEIGGKRIRAGDKVVMWYVSANRDPDYVEDPDRFIIDRGKPRQHLSFGYGIHRCVGARLAELQLTVLWEEILRRFPRIEVLAPPSRIYSNFIRGIASLPVRIPG